MCDVQFDQLAVGARDETLWVVDMQKSLPTLAWVAWVHILHPDLNSDEGNGEVGEASVILNLNLSLCPDAKSLHVGVGVGKKLLQYIQDCLHIRGVCIQQWRTCINNAL